MCNASRLNKYLDPLKNYISVHSERLIRYFMEYIVLGKCSFELKGINFIYLFFQSISEVYNNSLIPF